MTLWQRFNGQAGNESRNLSYQDVFSTGKDLTVNLFGNNTGSAVNETTALRLATVFACVRIITDNCSTLPIGAFYRKQGARLPFGPRPVWLDQPNPEMNRVQLFDQVFSSLLLHGNAYLLVIRDRAGEVSELWPIHPDTVKVSRDANRNVLYTVTTPGPDGKDVMTVLDRKSLLHIPGIRMAGSLVGISPLRAAMDVFGLGISAQEQAARFYANGSTPGGVIEVPKDIGDLSQEAVDSLKAAWNSYHQGVSKSNGLAVLTAGMSYKPISLSPGEAQFLESRQFQVAEICRIFGVPSHLVNDSTGSTSWGSGLEQQSIGFVRWTLGPWLERVEAALQPLLPLQDTVGPFLKFNTDALIRGDLSARYQAYATGIQNGWLSTNEVRAKEDLAPIAGGDQYLTPLNMAPINGTSANTNGAGA